MRSRPLPPPPQLTLSTRASPVLRLSTLFRTAKDAGLDGIDLDLTGRPLPRSPSQVTAAADRHGVPIRTVWIPRPGLGTGWQRGRAIDLAVALAKATKPSALLVDLPEPCAGRVSRALVIGVVESLRGAAASGTAIAVALRPWQLEGGRSHLVQLTALRRLAEEWDFGVALDLLGAVDPRWEAEAAVTRLGARLSLIRLGGEAKSGRGYWRHRATLRAMATALDNGQRPTLAIAPTLPHWWQTASAASVAAAAATQGRRIVDRFRDVDERRILSAFPNSRLGHPG